MNDGQKAKVAAKLVTFAEKEKLSPEDFLQILDYTASTLALYIDAYNRNKLNSYDRNKLN